MTFHTHAIQHSADAFFNSLVPDLKPVYDAEKRAFILQQEGATLEIPVKTFSPAGLHQFGERCQFVLPSGKREIGFLEAAEWVCHSLGGNAPQLYGRVLTSVRQLSSTLAARAKAVQELHERAPGFLRAEQGLFLGHNVHPAPKARDEFSEQDLENYTAEYAPELELQWLLVDPSILWEERSVALGNRNWQEELYGRRTTSGLVPFPVHPWQYKVLAQDSIIRDYRTRGLIREGASLERKWFPTSSQRTLFSPEENFMVKFSMSVRMTNSIRHLQKTEVVRGIQLHDVFHTRAGQEFKARFPRFRLMHEPAAMALKGHNGETLPQTMTLIRENPFRHKSEYPAVVLATLNQEHPFSQTSLLKTVVGELNPELWFRAFLEQAIVPLIVAQADFGLLLGAHQQNLLVELDGGLPVGAYFRDCQGTGHTKLAHDLFLADLPHPEKFIPHMIDASAAGDLFGYYLLINSVFSTISALARSTKVEERRLIGILRARLEELAATVRDPSILRQWLDRRELLWKSNFRCCVTNTNENTIDNPLKIYNPIPNPLHKDNQ